MTTSITTPPSERAQRQARQHATIRALITDLLRTSDPLDLGPLLTELNQMLAEHFDHEEEPGGVFEGLLEQNMSLQGHVAELTQEHRTFRARLVEATAALLGGAGDPMALAHALARDLSEHETRENDLIGDAFYTEMQAAD